MPAASDQALQSEKDKANGAAAKAEVSCISLPLTATDASSGFRMISIMRLDGTCLGRPTTAPELGALATSSLTDSLKRFGDPQIGAAAAFQVADHSAAVLSGSVKSGQVRHHLLRHRKLPHPGQRRRLLGVPRQQVFCTP